MHIYFFLASEGAAAEQELPDQAVQKRVQALLPGLRALTGQLDFIVTASGLGCSGLAGIAAKDFMMLEFVASLEALSSGGRPESVSKELNRLIGKEKILAALSRDMFLGGIRFLCGPDSLPADFAPRPLSLVHAHVKGFPNQGQGRVVEILTEDDLLKKG